MPIPIKIKLRQGLEFVEKEISICDELADEIYLELEYWHSRYINSVKNSKMDDLVIRFRKREDNGKIQETAFVSIPLRNGNFEQLKNIIRVIEKHISSETISDTLKVGL